MWHVFEDNCGIKTVIATVWSESKAWLIATENTSVVKSARGIRYGYERV